MTEDEVDTRIMLLFSDFTVKIVSSTNNPELLNLLKEVHRIKRSSNSVEIKTRDGEWTVQDNQELKTFLEDAEKISLQDLPDDVLGAYKLSAVIIVQTEG